MKRLAPQHGKDLKWVVSVHSCRAARNIILHWNACINQSKSCCIDTCWQHPAIFGHHIEINVNDSTGYKCDSTASLNSRRKQMHISCIRRSLRARLLRSVVLNGGTVISMFSKTPSLLVWLRPSGSRGPLAMHTTFVRPCSTYDDPSAELGCVLILQLKCRNSFHLRPS